MDGNGPTSAEIGLTDEDLGINKPRVNPHLNTPLDMTTQKRPFDLSGMEHNRIKQYQPEYIAKGGENLVYGLPAYPDYVVKVDMQVLINMVNKNVRVNKQINRPVDSDERAKIDSQISDDNHRFEELKRYFGESHILNQKKGFLKVPISKELLHQVYEARHQQLPEGVESLLADEAWTTITLQQRASEVGTSANYGVVAGYIEEDPREKPANYREVYDLVTDSLVIHPDQSQTVREEYLLMLHGNLYPLIQEVKTNSQARSMLSDFVQNAIRYTEGTGQTLDLGSMDNVTFYKTNEGNWNYRLVDPIHSLQVGDQIRRLNEVSVKMERNQADELDYLKSLGPINYARTINGLASILGIQSRVRLFPETSTLTASKLYDGMQNALKKQSEVIDKLVELKAA